MNSLFAKRITQSASAILLLTILSVFSYQVNAADSIEAGFSPEGTAHELVLKVINSSQKDIKMVGFIFSDPSITHALLAAKKRGVNVQVVLDHKINKGKSNIAAMNLLSTSGIPVKTDNFYRVQHDKAIIVDGKTVETGSYNYSRSANSKNSENVVVIWNDPKIAQQFEDHWNKRWNNSQLFKATY